MSTVDDVLIERLFSPLTGRLHHVLGISQWRVAIECLNGSVAFYIAGVAFSLIDKGLEDGIFVIMLRTLGWLLIMEAVRRLAYRQAASSVGVRTARVREWLVRTLLVGILPLSLWHVQNWHNLFYSGSLLLLIAHLYFKASDAPPPEPRQKLAYNRA